MTNTLKAIAIGLTMALSSQATETQDEHPTVEQWANYATPETLDAAPGIGPVLAQRIIEGRPYKDSSELKRVKGIGPITLAKIIAWVES